MVTNINSWFTAAESRHEQHLCNKHLVENQTFNFVNTLNGIASV